MTRKINTKSYLILQVSKTKKKLWSQLRYYYQSLLPRSVHRFVILWSNAWQFILGLVYPEPVEGKGRTLHRSVKIFNNDKFVALFSLRLSPFAYCLLIVAISSCSVHKKYQEPALELPKQFGSVSFSDTSSIADMQWKKFFADTALQGLIDRGLSYNHDLLMATKRIEIAQQRVTQSKMLQLPELNLQFTAQYNRPSNNSLNGISIKNFLGSSHVENYSTLASASWEADIWGKIRGQKESILAQYLQTYEARKAVQTQLVADIAQGYFNLLMLDRQLEIARKNLALSDSFLIATRLLKEAGIVNLLAVQQAESQKQSTALLVPQLEQSIAIQENALQVLTGQLPGAVIRSSSLDEFVLPSNLSTGLPVAMVSRRPDVRASEMALIAATAQIGVAHANMYPALNITVGGGLEAFKASNWFNIPGSLFGLAAGSIAQPIFKRKELRTRYEIAKLERENAVIQFKQSVLQATGEVVNALVQIDKLREQELIATAQVHTLHRAVFNAKLLFRSDLANYLEVITAQGNALQAELNLAAIQREQLAAIVELYRALGGGWK
jgi:NodT family efflux transporter outer membrane factor (OMF) lipoprotein